MRKVVVTEFISIDGVIEDPHLWHFEFWSDEMGQYKLDEIMATDALLLGRVTYDGFAAAWPDYEDEAGFADRMNGIPKYVASRTLENPSWNNTHILGDDVSGEIATLKEADGGDILICGSAELIGSLLDSDLIDEYRLMVHPIVVGRGKRLFGDDRDATKSFDLASSEPLPNGVTVLTYTPKPAAT